VQSKQSEICLDVLRRLDKAGVLSSLVLIGSWCLVAYREYFKGIGTVYAVKTRDMDFLVPPSAVFKGRHNVPDLLKDLGFIIGFRGEQGAMMLEHPELLIEFLVPDRGRGSTGLRNLPALGVNAQPLRFMDVALLLTVRLQFGDVPVVVPHPAAFALHKLLVAPRRKNAEKKRKDFDAALMILDLLDKKGEMSLACELLGKFPRPWKKSVLATLRADGRDEVATQLERATGPGAGPWPADSPGPRPPLRPSAC
jgi:hypothetical protein